MWKVSCQLLMIAIIGSLAWAVEPAPNIGDILRDPQDYHGHAVTLKGTIRQLKAGPSPFPCKCGLCYGRAYLTLEDTSGALPIEFLGACSRAPDAWPHLTDGDAVTIYAEVVWDHQYPGSAYAIGIHISK